MVRNALLVGIGSREVEIVVGKGAEVLHVQLLSTSNPVKAPAHEVASIIFLLFPRVDWREWRLTREAPGPADPGVPFPRRFVDCERALQR